MNKIHQRYRNCLLEPPHLKKTSQTSSKSLGRFNVFKIFFTANLSPSSNSSWFLFLLLYLCLFYFQPEVTDNKKHTRTTNQHIRKSRVGLPLALTSLATDWYWFSTNDNDNIESHLSGSGRASKMPALQPQFRLTRVWASRGMVRGQSEDITSRTRSATAACGRKTEAQRTHAVQGPTSAGTQVIILNAIEWAGLC